jgi:hypothetical protein
MAYTTNGKVSGPCPTGFDRRLPQIQLFAEVRKYDGVTKSYQLSDEADVFHVDFFNGWKEGKLQEIIDNCPFDDSEDYGYNPPCGCTPDDGSPFLTENTQVAAPICDSDVRKLIIDEATDVTDQLPTGKNEGCTLIPRSWSQLSDDLFDCTATSEDDENEDEDEDENSGSQDVDGDLDESSVDNDEDEDSDSQDEDEDGDFDESSGDEDEDSGSQDEDEDLDASSVDEDEDFGSQDEDEDGDLDESSGDEDEDSGSQDEDEDGDLDESPGDEDEDSGSQVEDEDGDLDESSGDEDEDSGSQDEDEDGDLDESPGDEDEDSGSQDEDGGLDESSIDESSGDDGRDDDDNTLCPRSELEELTTACDCTKRKNGKPWKSEKQYRRCVKKIIKKANSDCDWKVVLDSAGCLPFPVRQRQMSEKLWQEVTIDQADGQSISKSNSNSLGSSLIVAAFLFAMLSM